MLIMTNTLKELLDTTSPEIVKNAKSRAKIILNDMKEREAIIKELEILERAFHEQYKTTKRLIRLLKKQVK